MLDFLKKENKVVKENINQSSPVLQSGKEVQFKDEKTGEFVYQYPLSADQRKSIMETMRKNGQIANNFIAICRQEFTIKDQKEATYKAIIESEKEINEKVSEIRDELKLDRRWGLNMQLGVLERRDPPEG